MYLCIYNLVDVDCEWGAWSYDDCSVACGDGHVYRTRSKDPPRMNNGKDCTGEPIDCQSKFIGNKGFIR